MIIQNRTFYATFIGINAYKQSPLSGCIKDVLDMGLFMREQCAQQEKAPLRYEPFYLLAPNESDKKRLEDYRAKHGIAFEFGPPTFKNISEKAFTHFKQAKDGDICLFYYTIDVPLEINAGAYAVTGNDLQNKLKEIKLRGVNEEADATAGR